MFGIYTRLIGSRFSRLNILNKHIFSLLRHKFFALRNATGLET